MIDPNHDIVSTLRMFNGLIMDQVADEIERLRAKIVALEAAAPQEAETVAADGNPMNQKSVFLSNLAYFYGQTDGTYKWPVGLVADLLKQAKREIESAAVPQEQAPADRDAIRDAALDEAVTAIEKHAADWKASSYAFVEETVKQKVDAINYCAHLVRALQSQPQRVTKDE